MDYLTYEQKLAIVQENPKSEPLKDVLFFPQDSVRVVCQKKDLPKGLELVPVSISPLIDGDCDRGDDDGEKHVWNHCIDSLKYFQIVHIYITTRLMDPLQTMMCTCERLFGISHRTLSNWIIRTTDSTRSRRRRAARLLRCRNSKSIRRARRREKVREKK